jgi:fluoroacetyl-CoA thioesterase
MDYSGITVGLKHETHHVVDESLCTAHLGPEFGPILATPRLVGLFEHTCIDAVAPYLAAGYGTVGSEIHVKHTAPTPLGFSVRIHCELIEVDGPKLTFKITAFDDLQPVAEGEHRRAIVNVAKLKARLDQKITQANR